MRGSLPLRRRRAARLPLGRSMLRTCAWQVGRRCADGATERPGRRVGWLFRRVGRSVRRGCTRRDAAAGSRSRSRRRRRHGHEPARRGDGDRASLARTRRVRTGRSDGSVLVPPELARGIALLSFRASRRLALVARITRLGGREATRRRRARRRNAADRERWHRRCRVLARAGTFEHPARGDNVNPNSTSIGVVGRLQLSMITSPRTGRSASPTILRTSRTRSPASWCFTVWRPSTMSARPTSRSAGPPPTIRSTRRSRTTSKP